MRKLLTGIAAMALVAPLGACGSTDHTAREAPAADADVVIDENAAMDANAALGANTVDANAAVNADEAANNVTEQGSTDH
jgi:hypothetical protein